MINSKAKIIGLKQEIVGKVALTINLQISFIDILDDKGAVLAKIFESKDEIYLTENYFPVMIFDFPEFNELRDNDILIIKESGYISRVFEAQSEQNVLFLTNMCNNSCLCCSQPPKTRNDLEYFSILNSKIISLLPKTVSNIGITGGEPTLHRDALVELLSQLGQHLPDTHIDLLTNGRIFSENKFINAVANSDINLSKIIFCIPLFADNYLDHNFLTGSNSFEQTLNGIYNLAKINARIEIRIIITKVNSQRLEKIARYIYKNMTFVEHVAFMALENEGNMKINHDLLWIAPQSFMKNLELGIEYLRLVGIQASIYNIPLCLLPNKIRNYSAKSISDWKRYYYDDCQSCELKSECGGVFISSTEDYRNLIGV